MDRQQPEPFACAQEFLDGLTALSLKHGIAITGSPVLFLMEPEDNARNYQIDGDSGLSFS